MNAPAIPHALLSETVTGGPARGRLTDVALPTGADPVVGYIRHEPVYLDARGHYVVAAYLDFKRKHPVVECALCGEFEYDGDDVKLDDLSICDTCADAIMNLKHHRHSGKYITWPNEESPSQQARNRRKPIKPGLRRQVHERDYYACRYCGARQNLVVDHLVPVSRGGGNTIDNLVTACQACNTKKLDRSLADAGLTLHPPQAFAPDSEA